MTGIASAGLRHVFLHDFVLNAEIGVYPEEHARRQRVRIAVNLGVQEQAGKPPKRLEDVVDYAAVADRVRAIVSAGHIAFVEELAERIAADCLLDGRVKVARIRVEKLDAFDDIGSAGVEIERLQAEVCPPSRTSSDGSEI